MPGKLRITAILLSAMGALPVCGQDFSKLNFNIGGGMTAPLNPTANYIELSGNFTFGAGYNVNKHHSFSGEFMWNGLRPSLFDSPFNGPFGHINLYSITANYRYHHDRIKGSVFGLYVLGGGGWYYRTIDIDKTFVVDPVTPCLPIFVWWGLGCDTDGFVFTQNILSRNDSAGGVNAGTGFTIRLSDSGWKFYVESRYHYAWHRRVPTTFVPVVFGFRFN